MYRLFQYYSRYERARRGLGGLPGWARGLLFIAAVPGLLLVGLSIVAVLVSIVALLVVTVPVYRLLSLLTAQPDPPREPGEGQETWSTSGGPRKHVDVRIVE